VTASNLSAGGLGRLHDVMSGYVDRGTVPGLVSVVSRSGEPHVDAIGRTAFDGGADVTPATIFRISSMTKPITAVATLIPLEPGEWTRRFSTLRPRAGGFSCP
jgi:CubicO group peptidase (beta-lactamase class C family)